MQGSFVEAAMAPLLPPFNTSSFLLLSPQLLSISSHFPISLSLSLNFAMKIFVKLSPKRFFGSKKSRSDVSRSDPSSFSSGSTSSSDASHHLHKPSSAAGTPTSVLPGTSGDWSDLSAAEINFDLLHAFKPKGGAGAAVVSIKELGELLARLGAEPPSQDEVLTMLKELDCDGEGCVSVDALMSRVGSVCGPACDAELRETFDFFDTDHDGKITERELLEVFRSMGDERCTLEDCRRMIAVVDENKDGFVCFEDFSRMMELQR